MAMMTVMLLALLVLSTHECIFNFHVGTTRGEHRWKTAVPAGNDEFSMDLAIGTPAVNLICDEWFRSIDAHIRIPCSSHFCSYAYGYEQITRRRRGLWAPESSDSAVVLCRWFLSWMSTGGATNTIFDHQK
ncbi:hypothetical protein M569_12229 [Genlisea aurea]|uniref:Uncharacterized protein n=1 Tax=Genlisea aurea TaxID=192259 RepID=S8CDK9_9LAMI|nr:hypothetical protein M569_12229 [Genlisea aurea]